jgi:CRISPR system Cascade subunit CasB
MSIQFRKDNAFGVILFKWWEGLEDDRASRAVLRRAFSVTAVTLTPPYQRLYQRLCAAGWEGQAKPYYNDRLAAAIGLLAHVKKNDDRKPAKAMGRGHDGDDRSPVSELRFMRLLDSPDIESLFTGLRRVLPLMNHGVDVLALATDVVNWGDVVKKNWAYAYDWPEKSKN